MSICIVRISLLYCHISKLLRNIHISVMWIAGWVWRPVTCTRLSSVVILRRLHNDTSECRFWSYCSNVILVINLNLWVLFQTNCVRLQSFRQSPFLVIGDVAALTGLLVFWQTFPVVECLVLQSTTSHQNKQAPHNCQKHEETSKQRHNCDIQLKY